MKNKTLFIISLIGCLVVAMTVGAYAQGTAFTYQGRLQSGVTPTTGTYDMTFALYNASSGGGQVGPTLTDTGLQVTNGFFTVILDFGAVYNGTVYWLQIGVRTNGAVLYTALSPRQELTPTPYAITAENLDGTLSASQLTGTLPNSLLSGLYGNAVNFNNPADNFVGNGAGLVNVNAALLDGLAATNFWQLNGNANTTPGVNFLGTPDNQALDIRVNNARGLRVEPDPTFSVPNVIGGSYANFVRSGAVGNFIGGGGYNATDGTNFITGANLNTISGGYGNRITNGYENVIGGGVYNSISTPDRASTIGGGYGNYISSSFGSIPGGYQNVVSGDYGFAAGNDAQALHGGSFVWSDIESQTPFASANSNQFLVRAQFVGINRTNFVTGADVFDVSSPATFGYGGMYMDTAGTAGWPFYGYSQGGLANAWTYLDGSDTNKWKLNVAGLDRVTVTTTGRVGVHTTKPAAQLHVLEGSPSGSADVFGPNGGPGIWSDTSDTDAIFASTAGGGAYAVYAIARDNAFNAVVASCNNTNQGSGANGVSASTSATNGAAVVAYAANNSSTAVRIGAGSLAVTGQGVDTPTTAFIHVSTTNNTSNGSYITIISNPLTDGDPNAILIVTHLFNVQGKAGNYNTHPFSVWYNGSQWTIYNDDFAGILNQAYNVMVIKP